MRGNVQNFRPQARAQADELLAAIEAAEHIIVGTIERECEALRAGRMLAARALHIRLRDAAKLYLDATRAARASIWTLEQIRPGICNRLEERRASFSALLQVELAVLAAERAASDDGELEFAPTARAKPEAPPKPTARPTAPAIRVVSVRSDDIRRHTSGDRSRGRLR